MSTYKRKPLWAVALATHENPSRVVTITIEENGDQTFLNTKGSEIFVDIGKTTTRRASLVEPGPKYERWFFHALRAVFGSTGKVANWTRSWNTLWRVNTKPVDGPILTDRFGNIQYWTDRHEAIAAEVKFLDQFFFERTTP